MSHPFHLDENDNRFPQIYSFAVNPTNPAPFLLQVYQHLAPMNNMGLNRVDMSAYLEKTSCIDSAKWHKENVELIVRDLGRRAKLATDSEEHYGIVFVWDVEEITMLARNCLAEVRMLLPNMNGSIQWLWLLISRILEKANFQSNLWQKGEMVNIEDVLNGETDEMKEYAPKFNALKQLYNESGKLGKSMLFHDLLEKFGLSEYEQSLNTAAEYYQDIFHQRWKYAKRSLKLVNKRSAESKIKKFANVVMTQDELSFGIAQILISGTSKQIPIENVYSTRNSSEVSVWERIQKRFGEKCLLVHVTTQPIYMDRPYRTRWDIHANESIKYLYKAQRDVLVKDEENEERTTKNVTHRQQWQLFSPNLPKHFQSEQPGAIHAASGRIS